ncbi:MAG: hypothetical protein ABR606_17505 [Vicinamibacterales bacterium]
MRPDAGVKRVTVGALVLFGVLLVPAMTSAQPTTEDVEVEPLRCWWRASAGSVRVGQPFQVVLTCAVVETASTRVVPDQSRLDASVLQLPPFEVVGGTRAEDLRTVGERFFQYEYTLRLLAEEAFARDVPVPSLSISYRIETRTGQGGASQGREQIYELPPIPLRVASLVPIEANDIRELPPMTLAQIEARAFRASSMRLGAIVLFSVGALVVLAGLVGAARQGRVATEVRREVGERAILRRAEQVLLDVQRQRRHDGWTPDLVSRTIAALRVVASLASARAISQRPLSRGQTPADGEIRVDDRMRRASVAVSGSATATSSLTQSSPAGAHESLFGHVADGLLRLDRARYGRESNAEPDVERAVESGAKLARRLASDRGWLATRQAAIGRAVGRWMPGAAS